MSAFDKLIQKFLAGSQVSYKDAEKLLLTLGYEFTVRGSHHTFRKVGFTNVILKKRSQLIAYQIKELKEVLTEHGYEKQ